jgi:adenosylcobinamide kinase/adenosylcobinamide-phosphate guanylyltransferase
MGKEIVLITGGARSGKSGYAEARAARLGAKLLYLATAEPGDEEMARRIAEHRKRRGERWVTVEEPLEVGRVLTEHQGKVDCAVVDCVTLWISNLLIRRGEGSVVKATEDLIRRLPRLNFHLFFVTNEVGWGIIPDNPLARQFRDLSGWVNQSIGRVTNEIILMVAGVPVVVKEGKCS